MILAWYNFKVLLDVYTLEEQESCTNALLRNSSQIFKKCTVRTPFFAEFQKRLETLFVASLIFLITILPLLGTA